jgi:hypothetical protein
MREVGSGQKTKDDRKVTFICPLKGYLYVLFFIKTEVEAIFMKQETKMFQLRYICQAISFLEINY